MTSAIKLQEVSNAQAAFTLPREIIELWRFASTNEDRITLTFVYIEKMADGKTLKAQATDGHRAVTVEVPLDGTMDVDSLLIPAKDLKALKLKKDSVVVFKLYRDTLEYRVLGSDETRASKRDDECLDFPTRSIDACYPDYDGTRVEAFGINPDYLADIGAYAKKIGAGNNYIKIVVPAGSHDAIKVLLPVGNTKVSFLVMPVRL